MARPAQPLPRHARARSPIGRSMDIYYRDPARRARMDALNAQFIGAGDLAFDIGAHVGDRTGSFLRLGARVVSLEPQPDLCRALRLIYGRRMDVDLIRAAAGAAAGETTLFINSANPTVSTASRDLIGAAEGAPEWQGQTWDQMLVVPATTLDALIETHGVPDFVKIDVEGHELEVLKGVSIPLPALSFEFTTIQRDVAMACIDRLGDLGAYRYNLSLGEEHRLAGEEWVDAGALKSKLLALPASANSGDVFARLVR